MVLDCHHVWITGLLNLKNGMLCELKQFLYLLLLGPWELKQVNGKFIEQVIRPTGLIDPPVEIKPAKNQVDDLMHECMKTVEKNYRVLATTLNQKNG